MEHRRCPRCRQTVLVGVEDSNRAALPYCLDPATLDTTTELTAIAGGRLTWTMHWSGDVYLRRARTIRTRPAGVTPRQSVHADHACTGRTDQ